MSATNIGWICGDVIGLVLVATWCFTDYCDYWTTWKRLLLLGLEVAIFVTIAALLLEF